MYVWVYTAEVNAKRIRERYLQAVLRQDIAYFDDVGAGEVATRIQTDTRRCHHDPVINITKTHSDLVQQGMSEKVAMIINSLGQFPLVVTTCTF